MTLRCWNLPQVGQLLVDEPGGLVVAGLVCPVLHELPGDRICRDGAQARGASRPASKFVESLLPVSLLTSCIGIFFFLCFVCNLWLLLLRVVVVSRLVTL